MGDATSPLEKSFGQIRFVIKSMVVFSVILGAGGLLKDWSKPIDDARVLVFSVWWGLPLLFTTFLPIHLIYEIIWIHHRNRMEALRKHNRPRASGAVGGMARGRRRGR